IKYILGHNPLFPPYNQDSIYQDILSTESDLASTNDVSINAGVYEIGFEGEGFCFDNELGRHKIYLDDYTISGDLVTNGEYLEFINDGAYSNFAYWHSDGWDWVKKNLISAPLYWHKIHNKWQNYTLAGLKPINEEEPVCHISYYEAAAFAAWKG